MRPAHASDSNWDCFPPFRITSPASPCGVYYFVSRISLFFFFLSALPHQPFRRPSLPSPSAASFLFFFLFLFLPRNVGGEEFNFLPRPGCFRGNPEGAPPGSISKAPKQLVRFSSANSTHPATELFPSLLSKLPFPFPAPGPLFPRPRRPPPRHPRERFPPPAATLSLSLSPH